jgi:hypothetical protein
MLQRFALAAGFLAALGAAGCATAVDVPGTGGGGGEGGATTTSATTGTGGQGPCVNAADCADMSDTCNVGTCINGACTKQPANDSAACDDGLYCTENDVCSAGQCVGGAQRFCPAPDNCHIGVCNEQTKACDSAAGNDGAQCDDLDSCTGQGVCFGGVCTKGPATNCSIFDGPCSIGVCDPVTGCKPMPKNDGASCDDGKNSPCSEGACMAGVCTSVPANENGPCDDNKFCTINDHCENSVCVSNTPNPCAPPGGCFIASCDEQTDTCTAVPGNNGNACDDGNSCTQGTTCLNGACINGQPTNEGQACDDYSTCTSSTICIQGACAGGIGPTVYFADDFKDNSKGWVLGNEWEIGPAKASVGGVFGSDPDVDFTPSADNGVAGVVIGGNAQTVQHAPYWIESPSFDTSNAQGPVILGFRRWLNSDYDPYMHNYVEVYDGSKWVNLWKTGSSPGVQDSPPQGMGWTFIEHDLTQYKNAAMRVRFGFDITSSGVYTIGSWNVDDVLVASGACP